MKFSHALLPCWAPFMIFAMKNLILDENHVSFFFKLVLWQVHDGKEIGRQIGNKVYLKTL